MNVRINERVGIARTPGSREDPMARRTARITALVAFLSMLALDQGCYSHHAGGGYHRDFAHYTPEHTIRRHSRRGPPRGGHAHGGSHGHDHGSHHAGGHGGHGGHGH